jgi:tetratricopeptide (TPR) repeat protein
LTHSKPRGLLGAVRAPASARWLIAVWVALLACAEPATEGLVPRPGPPPNERDVELFVQRRLADARAFRAQDRLEAAERALERALALAPDHAPAHRLMARVLEDQGRMAAAREHWARADALDPPPPPPPDTPVAESTRDLAVLLVGGADDEDDASARARRPDPALERRVLENRLQTRLPEASIAPSDPESVAEARALLRGQRVRAALSLRVERGFCGSSQKDGDFAVVWLRVASAAPGGLVVPPVIVREVISDPPGGEACVPTALSRALERVLRESGALRALRERSRGDWPSPALRALFPGLGRRVAAEIERGRAALATGRIADSADAFRGALAVDPEDADARAYLREAEDTLAIARALGGDAQVPGEAGGELHFSLTPAERSIAESLLAEERQRRDELLAALVVAEVDERPPPPEAIASLRPLPLPEPPAHGPRLARARSDGPIEARGLYDGSGSVVALYYFAGGSREPLLREEDVDGDGRPDRWIVYSGGARHELIEDRNADGAPDVVVGYGPDGEAVERIELDVDADGVTERVFRYAGGRLASESRDTDGDGRLDRVESFDAGGDVVAREEDLNGDGKVDVRSTFREGRLVSREIEDPVVVERLLKR